MSREQLEALFLDQLPAIEKILAAVVRHHFRDFDDADDFRSWAMLRLVENDYAKIAKFRGESSLKTYLTTVINRLYREYRVQEYGRWRPSAFAKQKGTVAIQLETLVSRDGLSVAVAGELLRTAKLTEQTDAELARIAAEFPTRFSHRPIRLANPPESSEGKETADEDLDVAEAMSLRRSVDRALASALKSLGDEDRLIVRLHFLASQSVADVARTLGMDQKPLYRRLNKILKTLRGHLEGSGVSQVVVSEIAAKLLLLLVAISPVRDHL